jgi:hypothetical protein
MYILGNSNIKIKKRLMREKSMEKNTYTESFAGNYALGNNNNLN